MALIEIVVSAMLLIVVALGVFTAFDAGTRASAEERHRARAHAIAEADIARMQSMRIEQLSSLNQTNPVNQDGFTYTVRSQATFVNEPASTATCAAGTGSRDYINIRSTVTWATIGTRPPVSITSIVSPPNGSVVPGAGSLLVSVKNAQDNGISGVVLTGSGPSSFSGTTGPTGCVLWRNLPAGNYTMSIGGAASGKVDPNGDAPSPQTVSVVAQSTNTVSLQYDTPGRIQGTTFRTRNYSNSLVTSAADVVIVDHIGMDVAKSFGTPGNRVGSISTPSTLFPFASPYSLYAGLCGDNNPGAAPGLGSVVVPAGGSPTGPVLQLPALHLTVRTGSSLSNPGDVVPNAKVLVEDTGCDDQPTPGFKRSIGPTDSLGRLPNPGLPHSTYRVCADAEFSFNGNDFIVRNYVRSGSSIEQVPVQSYSAGTVRTVYLSGSGATLGACPP